MCTFELKDGLFQDHLTEESFFPEEFIFLHKENPKLEITCKNVHMSTIFPTFNRFCSLFLLEISNQLFFFKNFPKNLFSSVKLQF